VLGYVSIDLHILDLGTREKAFGTQNRSEPCEEEKILAPTGTRTPTPLPSSPYPVAIPTALSRLQEYWDEEEINCVLRHFFHYFKYILYQDHKLGDNNVFQVYENEHTSHLYRLETLASPIYFTFIKLLMENLTEIQRGIILFIFSFSTLSFLSFIPFIPLSHSLIFLLNQWIDTFIHRWHSFQHSDASSYVKTATAWERHTFTKKLWCYSLSCEFCLWN
jgi:hypothetical protein